MPKSAASKPRSRAKSSTRRVSSARASSSRTLTRVKTNVITDTKILMATIALLLSTGLSLIAVPAAPGQMQLAAAAKCGVNKVTYGRVCAAKMYTGARVVCHDGSFADVGAGQCLSVAAIAQLGNVVCQNKCSDAVVVAPQPRLTVRTNVDTPLGTNLVLGSVDTMVAKFDLIASNVEDINLRDFAVSFHLPEHLATGTLRNIRLFDGDVQVSENIAHLGGAPTTSTFHTAVFHNINLRLLRSQVKTLIVKADMSTYENNGFLSGVRFQPAILNTDYDQMAPGVQLAVNAEGLVSGSVLQSRDIVFIANAGTVASGSKSEQSLLSTLLPRTSGYVGANQFVVYRTKLVVMWAADTPTGFSAPASGQVIGKFIVNNFANNGNYNATVRATNVNLSSNRIVAAQPRTLNIYRDSLQSVILATTQFQGVVSGNSGFEDRSFGDVEISSGANKTFFVTFDTIDALANQALLVNVPWSVNEVKYFGLLWSDGVVHDIVASDNGLPLAPKTLVY